MPNWTAVNHFQLFISKNREIPTHVYTKRLLLMQSNPAAVQNIGW